jgi:hypothetical protein
MGDEARDDGLTRRALLRGTAGALGAAALAGTLPAAPAHALAGWPTFTYRREVVLRDALRYNPTNELIFPSIRRVAGRVPNPLGGYYLYYSPHDPPGGICLAHADSLAGPFTEYAGNPVLGRSGQPYGSVSHVASPHVLWNESNATLYLYYHGENDVTRLARSKDGISWTYVGEVVRASSIPGVTETSYARAFRYPVQGVTNTYLLLFMGNQNGTRKIFLAWSTDQREWTVRTTPLVVPPPGETQIGNPHLLVKDGVPHVVHNGASGRVYVNEVGPAFDRSILRGVLHEPLPGFPDNGRAAAPAFAKEGDTVYMYYEAGTRLDGRIALATAPATGDIVYPV